jgi:hypothetical protein
MQIESTTRHSKEYVLSCQEQGGEEDEKHTYWLVFYRMKEKTVTEILL